MKPWIAMAVALVLAGCSTDHKLVEHNGNNFCLNITTSVGNIDLLVNAEKAPLSAQNMLDYVNAGHYSDTVFHRVIEGFMIQGGGHNLDMSLKETGPSIANESDNGLLNRRGTLAMARKRDPHSATAQFFINLVDNAYLNHKGEEGGWGYTVFGEVVSGMDVVDAIASVETATHPLGMSDVPLEPVVIKQIKHMPCPE